MAIVGVGQDRTPNQLPTRQSKRFFLFLERDPAGLPPYLTRDRKAAADPQGRTARRERQPWKRGSSLTSEQLEASRAERMRQNGVGTLTLEDARTWIEETGLCLFLPRKQFSTFVAPSFVEAVAGERNSTPAVKVVALAEDLLVRLETEGVAV